MSIDVDAAIRKALEKRLKALAINVATAYENTRFDPKDGIPYQRCNVLRAEPYAPEMSRKMTIYQGIFQVTLFYPVGSGADDCEAQAGRIVEHFKAPLTMIQDGVSVQVLNPAAKSSGFNTEGRWVLPISIPYVVNFNG